MTTGERIKQRRKELGISQEELARRCGYTGKSAISRIENAPGSLHSDIIMKIAPALGMAPSVLLEGKEFKEFLFDYYDFDADDIRLIDNYRCLTDAGQRKLEEYLFDLLGNPENVIHGVEPYGRRRPFEGGSL